MTVAEITRAALLALTAWAALAASGCSRTVADGKADGAAIYAEACAGCHGPAGTPVPQMAARGIRDLADPALQARLTDDQIRAQIRRGSRNRQMPAFESALSDAQIDAVARYVREFVRSNGSDE
jgi:mono/diheme cytochrome c family protein